MILIIGGAFQGKLAYALKAYNLTENDVCDLAVSHPEPGYKCYWHLEALSRRNNDITRFLPLFEDAVVIARQVNGGMCPWTVRSGHGGKTTACSYSSWRKKRNM